MSRTPVVEGAPLDDRRDRPIRRLPPVLTIAALCVAVALSLPLVYLALRAAEATPASWDLILRDRTVWLTVRTLVLAAAVTAASVAIGVTAAWLVMRTDLPRRRFWAVAFALPLVFPSYVGAFALLSALGPRGLLQQLVETPFGTDRLPDISGFPGAFLALTLFTYPYVFLTVAAGIRGLDPALEEAARTLGQSRWRVFLRVTLPMLRPSIVAGGLLVALYTLHDFGAVSLMRYQTFTQAIFLQYRAAFDRTPAAILSLILVALALGVLALEQRARGRARYYRAGTGAAPKLRPVALGRWRILAVVFAASVTLAALVLPVTVLAYWLARGLTAGTPFNLTMGAAANALLVSAGGALVALAAALPVALLAGRFPGTLSRGVERVSYVGYALPGIVVALSLVFFAANYAPGIYQSLPLVIGAYVVLFLPQVSEPLRGAILQVNPSLEDAGRTLGLSRARVLRRVVLPLVARPALAGVALVFLTAMKELPATLLLRPTGFETLATRIWTGASAGLYSRAAAPALLLIAICSVPLFLLAGRIEIREVRPE
ncbi:MAG: iron ABC transporter permease [Actinomycetota bacterium]